MAGISIHAPREGGDRVPAFGVADIRISIHAPREGGDWQSAETPDSINIFQSTPPARGATKIRFHTIQRDFDFNPRPPRGGRPCITHPFCFKYAFQSTPPARGATLGNDCVLIVVKISIHAPREGGDIVYQSSQTLAP